jgi:hypothetical protein
LIALINDGHESMSLGKKDMFRDNEDHWKENPLVMNLFFAGLVAKRGKNTRSHPELDG